MPHKPGNEDRRVHQAHLHNRDNGAVMTDWTILPVVCGQNIIHGWINFFDIVNFENACMSHQARATYLQWCTGVLLSNIDNGTALNLPGTIMNPLLKWLQLRGVFLRRLSFVPDMDFSFVALQEYLQIHGSIVTELHVEFDPDYNSKEDFNIVDATLFLAQLHGMCPNVRVLSIQGWFNDGGLTALVNTLPHLESLSIIRCEEVGAVGLSMVGRFCSRLQQLTIEGVTGADTGEALQLIGRGCTNLTKLSLVDYDYSPPGEIQSTDVAIAFMLKYLPKLSYLKLGRLDTMHAASIAAHLRQLKHLTVQNSCEIGDTELEAIFAHCPQLQELDLSHCPRVTEMGVRHIRHLTRFTMRGNSVITDAMGEVLGRNNPGLVSVGLEEMGRLSGRFVLKLVRHCPELKELVVWKETRRLYEANKMRDLVGHLLHVQYPQLKKVDVSI